jgi:hypothetical protein
MRHCGNRMNLSNVQKLLLAANPFTALRANLRGWRKKLHAQRLRGRHLTVIQRENISTELQESMTGPVSMTATATDREAVCYEGEIANVLEDTGFSVEIDNAERKAPEPKIPAGVEMTIADETIRPAHASRIVRAFRSAGVGIATRINPMRRKNNTLYITVGPNDAPGLVPAIKIAATGQSNARAALLKKWKARFS